MNLVTCSEPCCYQQDGFCTLTGAAHASSATGICCYYEARGGASPLPRKDF